MSDRNLLFRNRELLAVKLPDLVLLGGVGQIHEIHGIEALRPRQLRRQLADVRSEPAVQESRTAGGKASRFGPSRRCWANPRNTRHRSAPPSPAQEAAC